MATRALAPAIRFPCVESLGSTVLIPSLLSRTFWTAKYGDFAIIARKWVKLVMYRATPGTFLLSTVSL